MPYFSILIPAYNRELLIGQTLDSIFAQRFSDFEVIVADDGSTDGTIAKIKSYGSRIKLLQQANHGPGAARNLAASVATGEYLAMIDSDDLMFPWTLETYRKVIQQHNNPSVVTGKPLTFESGSTPVAEEKAIEVAPFRDYIASGDEWRWFSASCFVMKREAFNRIGGFSSRWINGEDADLIMRMGVEPGFVQVLSPHTFAYREHAGNVMKNIGKNLEGLEHGLNEEEKGRYPGGPERAEERRRILCRNVRPMVFGLLSAGMKMEAWALYRRTFAWNLSLGRIQYLLAFPFKAMTTYGPSK